MLPMWENWRKRVENEIEKWLEVWSKAHGPISQEEDLIARSAWAFQQGVIWAMGSKIQAMQARIDELEKE